MRNIKLVIQYDGTSYHGWQIQPGVPTIQGVLLEALRKITGEKAKVYAAARTDSGVHARCQVVSFETASSLLPKRMQCALNSLLPEDIVVVKASRVSDGFHARYCARSRLYRYTMLNRKFRSPFSSGYCYFFPYAVDIDAMKDAAEFLVGEHDFSSFEARFGRREKSIRTIEKINIFSRAGFICTDIQANGFLTHMVRIVMGTLLDVGRGKTRPADIERILEAKDRQKAGATLPAKGLCLMKVTY